MHVALIIDGQRLEQEQAMLNRLCIGLMAEGVRLTRIVPDDLDAKLTGEGEQRIALAPRIEAPFRVLPWMRGTRVTQLSESYDAAPPDVLYAVGRQSWPLAIDLAEELESPLVLDVCSIAHAHAVPRPADSDSIAGYTVACGGIESALAARIERAMIHPVPMGVSIPSQAVPLGGGAKSNAETSLAVIGDAQDLSAYRAMFRGIAPILEKHDGMQVFLELRGRGAHGVWREAEQANVIGCISAIGEAGAHRRLLTRCSAVLMPEVATELRSIVLEAMAHAVPIIGAGLAKLELLVEEQTAWQVTATAESWQRQIDRLLFDPPARQAIGERARAFVSASHRSSVQVARLLEVLDRLGGQSLRLIPGSGN